jgi:hypothetical protein
MGRKGAVFLAVTHVAALAAGFGLGVYLLPILTAPEGPSAADVKSAAAAAQYTGTFRKDQKGSDFLHWGEGTVSVSPAAVTLTGRVSPGPDYKLYLSADFVETKEEFLKVKGRARRIGDVKTFENFILPVPQGVDVGRYTTVVVWCETFSMFIASARYRQP